MCVLELKTTILEYFNSKVMNKITSTGVGRGNHHMTICSDQCNFCWEGCVSWISICCQGVGDNYIYVYVYTWCRLVAENIYIELRNMYFSEGVKSNRTTNFFNSPTNFLLIFHGCKLFSAHKNHFVRRFKFKLLYEIIIRLYIDLLCNYLNE